MSGRRLGYFVQAFIIGMITFLIVTALGGSVGDAAFGVAVVALAEAYNKKEK